jgi:alpha-glucosidase
VATYYGAADELHLAFNFLSLGAGWDAARWRALVAGVAEELGPRDAWPTWVLSNHDAPRHRTRFGGSERRARAAAVLLLGLRGTPFLYAGEELGVEDARVPPERAVDPGGRDGCRAPIPWDDAPLHGWAAEPWLPWPPEPGGRSAAALERDPGSILHLYRRMLAARRASPALRGGDLELLPAPADVLAFARRADGDRRVVLVNFGAAPADVPHDGAWTVAVASAGEAGGRYPGVLAGEAAVVLAPA